MPPSYPYLPVGPDEIRILILTPGLHDQPLSGRLEVAKLDDSPEYHAISYTWGAPILDKVLQLAGPNDRPEHELKITESLHGALRRFRNPTEDVRLWADAICINQIDVKERNQQVDIMAQIFGQAERVLVWLGEQIDDDTLAFWMIAAMQRYHNKFGVLDTAAHAQSAWDHMTRRFETSYLHKEQTCHCCHTKRSTCLTYNGVSSFCASLRSLVRLLERPYFTRMWVVQEITGIREQGQGGVDFYCGKHMRTGTSLFRAVATCDSLISYFDGPVELAPRGPSTPVFATFEFLSRVPDHLIYTLMATRNLQCSHARDRLFGGRALADIEDEESLRPDYGVDIDTLWQRVATFLLVSRSPRAFDEGGIDSSLVLALIGTHDASAETGQRSSWAPHFGRLARAARDKQRFYEMECGGDSAIRAGGTRKFQARGDQNNPMNLIVRGKKVSSIRAILPASQFQAASKAAVTVPEHRHYVEFYLLPWYINCYRFLNESNASGAWRAGFHIILQQGAKVGRRIVPPWERIGWLFEQVCGQARIQTLDARQVFDDLNAFLARRISHGYYLDQKRLLACSDDGRACWVPELTAVGDDVFVLEGAPFAFVLRSSSDGRYSVLGDSYVHGIMAGEAWPNDLSEISDVVLR